MTNESNGPSLSARQIRDQVLQRLKRYEKLSDLEQFALFMGLAQILEAGLKNLLARKYGYDHETMEKWTLGKVRVELESSGLRSDFIELLKSVVDYRNHIAHEYLANEALLRAILDGESGRLNRKVFERAAYELEQLLLLHDWCNEHNAWD